MTDEVTLDELPQTVLYDLFQEAATVLTGLYLEQQRAGDSADAATWWDKVITVRDQVRAADPDDRDLLVDHLTRWRREAADLTSG
jgi:hypothetical protein